VLNIVDLGLALDTYLMRLEDLAIEISGKTFRKERKSRIET
jgi:hypothetical protein